MLSTMQDYPLTIVHLFDRAARYHRDRTITTATAVGRERITYGEWAERTRRLGGVLDDLGINCKPAAGLGMKAIKVIDVDQTLGELAAHTGLAFA